MSDKKGKITRGLRLYPAKILRNPCDSEGKNN